MCICAEEAFGPVISILQYDDSAGFEEAIDLANNTEFGLGGIVFGADADRAQAVAEQVDSVSVGVNFFGSNHNAPFGGRHHSGLGVEYGVEGLSQYVSYQSIHRKGWCKDLRKEALLSSAQPMTACAMRLSRRRTSSPLPILIFR
ncbi:hypothetical protein GCM10009813_37260 [Brevibacterium marinum]